MANGAPRSDSGIFAGSKDDDDDDLEVLGESVKLRRTDDSCAKGTVFQWIRNDYTETIKTLLRQVKTSKPIVRRLQDIARALEHQGTDKTYMIQHHPDWLSTARSAVNEVKRYLKQLEEAYELLEVEEDDVVFTKGILRKRTKQAENAEKAQMRLKNLIGDLKDNLAD